MAEYIAGLYPAVMWKEELMNDETGHLAETSKHNIEGMAQILLSAHGKIPVERGKLRKEQLNKEKIELDDLENSHLDFKRIKIKIFTAWRAYSLEKTTYVIGKSFANIS